MISGTDTRETGFEGLSWRPNCRANIAVRNNCDTRLVFSVLGRNVHVPPPCCYIGLLCSLFLTMPFVDGDADADGGDATAAGGRSGRRDCNIGQRLHSCFKLDLLKSFRRTTPTGANWDGKYIFYRTVVHRRSVSLPAKTISYTCVHMYMGPRARMILLSFLWLSARIDLTPRYRALFP